MNIVWSVNFSFMPPAHFSVSCFHLAQSVPRIELSSGSLWKEPQEVGAELEKLERYVDTAAFVLMWSILEVV